MIDDRFFTKSSSLTLKEICDLTKSTPFFPDEISQEETNRLEKNLSLIDNVTSLEDAGAQDIACFHNHKYLESFKKSKAGFCFVDRSFVSQAPRSMVCLVTSSPYRAFGLTALAFYPNVDRDFEPCETLIHPTARIKRGAIIEPGAVIRRNAEIGSGTFIGANSVIGPGVKIGNDCLIESQVTITHTLMGNKITILTGTRIGQAGFGFFMDKMGHVKVPQLGRVLIGNDVEIGANTTVDRGSMKDTVIGEGCRIDNLVQVAHNVELGKGCVLVSQVGISGSTRFGDYVIVGGQSGFAGHLSIGSGARIAAKTGIMKDVLPQETVAGSPSMPIKDWHRQSVILSKLVKNSKTKKATS